MSESMVERANEEMVRGYNDGFEKDAVPPSGNRTASYRHGWLNGRDDRRKEPRDSAENLRLQADEAMAIDAALHDPD